MNSKKTKQLTACGMFAALIFVATLTGAVAPLGGGAYVHIGDAAIYTAVLVLPTPFAATAAAVGAGLADLTLGSAVYIIPTVIIKSLTVLAAKGLMRLSEKPLVQDMLICLSGIVTIVGYYCAKVVMLTISGSAFFAAVVTAAAETLPFDTIQALASAVVFLAVAVPVRRIADKMKKGDR